MKHYVSILWSEQRRNYSVKSMIYRVKNLLKKNSVIYAINALIKSTLFKIHLKKLHIKYNAEVNARKILYSRNDIIDNFKANCKFRKKDFTVKDKGELNIYWVGASKAQDETGFLQALKKFGVVTTFYNSKGEYGPIYAQEGQNWKEIRTQNDKELLKQVRAIHSKQNIDIFIGQMWTHVFSQEAIKQIQKLGIPTINISMDDRLPNLWHFKDGVRMGAVGYGQSIDMTLTTSSEVCKWYSVEGMNSLFWPLASDPDLFASSNDLIKDIEILFVGNRYGVRSNVIKFLENKGVKVECYGNGWLNGFVNADQNINLSKRAKIILGFGTIGHCKDIYTLKLRDFDALMTGALYITHRNPDLLHIFQEGRHLECYSDKEELLRKIRYYTKEHNKAKQIGDRAQTLARSEHSWDFRLTETFMELGFIN